MDDNHHCFRGTLQRSIYFFGNRQISRNGIRFFFGERAAGNNYWVMGQRIAVTEILRTRIFWRKFANFRLTTFQRSIIKFVD